MAMDKDILGQALYDAETDFNNKTSDELIAAYGSIEGARLALNKLKAQAIVDHLKTSAQIPALGLAAPDGPVTGEAKII